ncbi:GM20534 [Drosophila sechellia]|uniref:GM20534 n=1 Tax=Drosophila sechellia TaxID=7238 RepID=B4HMN5_DROSE|nr:GM20534 [Drosophila sechellia]
MDAVRSGALNTRGAPAQVLGLALAPLCIWPPGRRAEDHGNVAAIKHEWITQ